MEGLVSRAQCGDKSRLWMTTILPTKSCYLLLLRIVGLVAFASSPNNFYSFTFRKGSCRITELGRKEGTEFVSISCIRDVACFKKFRSHIAFHYSKIFKPNRGKKLDLLWRNCWLWIARDIFTFQKTHSFACNHKMVDYFGFFSLIKSSEFKIFFCQINTFRLNVRFYANGIKSNYGWFSLQSFHRLWAKTGYTFVLFEVECPWR